MNGLKGNYRDPGVAIASVNRWIIDLLIRDGTVTPGGVVVVGQSDGGWKALALSSRSPAPIRAIIAFAAGRGGHIDNKPNNNCAPDKLVEAAAQFGTTARTPVLAIYTRNDSYFGADPFFFTCGPQLPPATMDRRSCPPAADFQSFRGVKMALLQLGLH